MNGGQLGVLLGPSRDPGKGSGALWRSENTPYPPRPKLTALEPASPPVIKEAMEKIQKWTLVKAYKQ